MNILLYIFLGFLGGLAGGALGIGGGTILVPVFVLGLGLTQHQAQGTVLAALLPPVFILAAWRYYVEGNVNVQLAIFAAIGILIGALVGAHIVQDIPSATLKKIFGVFLLIVGIKMVFFK